MQNEEFFVNSFRELGIFKILRLEKGEQINSEVIEHQFCVFYQITFGNVEFSSSELQLDFYLKGKS